MKRDFRRRHILHMSLAFGAPFAVPAARACEFFSTNLRVIHPWTRATPDDADAAVVCMQFDDVAQPDRLIGVETPVATGAEMGGSGARPGVDFWIPAGQASALSESATFVRLTQLKFPLQAGREYPLKLVFERGGIVMATLNVDYARFK